MIHSTDIARRASKNTTVTMQHNQTKPISSTAQQTSDVAELKVMMENLLKQMGTILSLLTIDINKLITCSDLKIPVWLMSLYTIN